MNVVAEPASGRLNPWNAVRDEVSGVLSTVSGRQMASAAALFADRDRRWFLCGQGRSGLVAQMAAMRLMHVGFKSHAVGEATAPSIGDGDGLVVISGSGQTAVTLHLAALAHAAGARILAVTTRADNALAHLAHVVIEVPTSGTDQFGGHAVRGGCPSPARRRDPRDHRRRPLRLRGDAGQARQLAVDVDSGRPGVNP